MTDFIARLISIPFFVLFFGFFVMGLFGRVTKHGWRVPFLSGTSIFLRALVLVFSFVFFIIATKLWN